MRCVACDAENAREAKFCQSCGSSLALLRCPRCGHGNRPGNRYCIECGNALVATQSPSAPSSHGLAPLAYTPAHLAEKIRAARGVFEGERKHVTVMFADIKGSTELIHALDTEVAQRLLDGAVKEMMDAVHRYEGTVCTTSR